MKSYFFAGAVALMGVAFVSCSHDLGDATASESAINTYNKAFVNAFGQPAANNNWGFGEEVAAADITTRAENANANEWADVSNNTGYGGWIVPDPLTDGQKLRVKAYFQSHPYITYEDPHLTNFFVQQVYKGATDPGPFSTEVVTAADGSKYTSDNMNHLTVGQGNVHINNFNRGDATLVNVLDSGANIAMHTGETYHGDKIMLMVDIDDTSCFGYHDSGSSNELGTINHNDKAALVAASIIDAWADSVVNTGGAVIGEPVVDHWNRSFMGFDLAIKEGDQCFMLDDNNNVVYANYSQLPESCTWWSDADQKNYIVAWDGEKVIKVGELNADYTPTFYSGYETLAKSNGTKAGWLSTNKNFYVAGTSKTIAQSAQTSLTDESVILKEFTIGGIKYQALINLPAIQGLLDEGYLPVNNKNLTEWVKPGVSDGYFSDWIVTLTEANRTPVTWGDPVRIIAEDLSVRNETAGRTDFDFNDVVFDVCFNEEKTKAKITLLAAGGTLPLTVGWTGEPGTVYTPFEVHELFKVSTGTMVNTHATNGVDDVDPVTYIIEGSFPNGARDVKLMVFKSGEWIELMAHTGEPASKICVGTDYEWCVERQDIRAVYRDFTEYVKYAAPAEWWKTLRITE